MSVLEANTERQRAESRLNETRSIYNELRHEIIIKNNEIAELRDRERTYLERLRRLEERIGELLSSQPGIMLECFQSWLSEPGNSVAAIALRDGLLRKTLL